MRTFGIVAAWVVGAIAFGAGIWLAFGWDLWRQESPPEDGAAFAAGWYGAYVPLLFLTGAALLLPATLIVVWRRDRANAPSSPPASPRSAPPPPPPARR